ncbi:MAG: zinc ribbon domain-containing protein [Clostridia bacterium]|nr:zinc ribbon domain-containing protein [Clostridia bacterium]
MRQFVIIGIVVITVAAIAMSIFVSLMIFSPKFRGKFMSKEIKATKYMMDESKEDFKSISTDMANATKDGVEITTQAIKRGLSEPTNSEYYFCKYCGAKVDKDSKFCKNCGKEL